MSDKIEKYGTGIVRTYSGVYVDVLNPDPDTIIIEDIAYALSNLCRFGGHTRVFYSVAEHSLRCKFMARDSLAQTTESRNIIAAEMLSALLHDASEAYLVDIPSPVKRLLPKYYELENNLMRVISEKFGFKFPLSQRTVDIDAVMLNREWDGLMVGYKWQVLSRDAARAMFLKEFDSIDMYRNNEIDKF